MRTLLSTRPLTIKIISGEPAFLYSGNTVTLLMNADGHADVSINNVHYKMNTGDIVLVNSSETYTIFESDCVLLSLAIDKTQLTLNEKDLQAHFACNSTLSANKESFLKLSQQILNIAVSYGDLSEAQAFSYAYGLYDCLLKSYLNYPPPPANCQIQQSFQP